MAESERKNAASRPEGGADGDRVDGPRPAEAEGSRGLLAWFAGNTVAANLLMLVILVGGGLSLLSMRVEVFQDFDPGLIRIQVPYPGASPDDVESGVVERIEEAIKGIDGIDRVTSVAREGSGTVVAELTDYADDREVLDEVKLAVDRIPDFPPEEAEEPVVVDVDANPQIISIVLYGDASDRTLKELAERVRDDLTTPDNPWLADPDPSVLDRVSTLLSPARGEVSLVEPAGALAYEISIEVSEAQLRKYNITFAQVADAIADASLDLPGGSVRTDAGEILLRVKNKAYTGSDFEELILLTRPDGTQLRVRDVARVSDGFVDEDSKLRFNGEPAVLVNVFRTGPQDALRVAAAVKRYVEARPLPEGVKMATWSDRAVFLEGRMNLLIRNAILGLALVFLSLTLFLDLRLAFWTTLGIPISFMGGFMLFPLMGVSINMISLFALIIVLGIVVDDAIVVGENVFEYHQQGMSPLTAAIRGVSEMAQPVTLAILTTVAAFLPLVWTAGQIGQILWPIAAVVCAVLLVSLVEALLILPAHLTSVRTRDRKPGVIGRTQAKIRGALDWFVNHVYARHLDVAARYRYVSLAGAIGIFVLTLGVIQGGHIGFRFFPDVDADNVWARLKMPEGTPYERTAAITERLLVAAEQLRAELDADRAPGEPSTITHVAASVGQQPFAIDGGGPGGEGAGTATGTNIAEVNLELLGAERRGVASRDVADRWRELVGATPGVSSLTFNSAIFDPGDPVNIELSHRDFNALQAAATRLRAKLEQFQGVFDITDSFEPGKAELRFELTDAGVAAGLSERIVARQVRDAYFGREVQRIQRGREDIKVMVRFPEADRETLDSLDDLRIRLPDGTAVPLRTVATPIRERGYAQIDRVDRRKVIVVSADVDETIASAQQVNAELREVILPELAAELPGLVFSFEGEQRELAETQASFIVNGVLGLLVIYALLAVQFRSYVQPIIIMCVIPFGLVGAVIGHLVMGMDLTMLSFFGIIALTGVVVNDSLIMIDLINRQRGQPGAALRDAILRSGIRRFRPILLTTMTTFFGLIPMITETSLQAKFLIPMAVSLGFGVLFATGITLMLVPIAYLILEDTLALLRRMGVSHARTEAPAQGVPAAPAPA